MINIITNNSISFKRLPYEICKGYTINVITTLENGNRIKTTEDVIENSKIQTLIKEKITLDYHENLKWELPNDIVASSSDGIKVYINKVELSTNSYSYNPNINLLYLNKSSNVDENSLIEVEYNIDKIVYKCKNNSECEYEVIPIFQDSYRLGQHTVI